MDYGFLSLVPPLIVIIIALITRLSLEPLIIGCLAGFAIIAGWGFFDAFLTSLQHVMQDDQMVWVILVCSMYGSLINLMIRSGGTLGFGNYMLRYANTPKRSMFITWMFGTFLFVDDYMNALTSGTTMKKITDHFRISREMLAFLVSSTAVTTCLIVPISTWVIFIGKLVEGTQIIPAGEGITAYLNIIPFIAYGWVQYVVVGLVIFGVIPVIGKMRKANKRALETGQVIPDNSEEFKTETTLFKSIQHPHILNLVLPLVVLVTSTILLDKDALKGVVVTLVFTVIYYALRKVATFKELSEAVIEGLKSMLFALVLLVMSYILKDLGDQMGLTQYVIRIVSPVVSKAMLPLCVFLSLGFIAFTTGNSWGLYAIAIPLVVSLAQQMGANVWLCIGAVVSAGAFGAHACFYSDATILAAQGTECNNYEHAITQLPFALISFSVSCVVYVVLGYVV
ncbi:sodium:proton antiporter [Panacibacter sp. DH6]|uniref:Sodium:proton antiporter n=1 Tax=Panacibacter microcysteis TaxID=2793269 RepID=A0A931E7L4_9BACT|nr:Na+/H+ antiporter NhaC family protein [Panacibacter microcysteis]MBG9377672.1 sodium:proton antiporter [Panacibacter microcysteis]